jgi:hypothetical protein
MKKLLIAIFAALVTLTIEQPTCKGFYYAPEGAKCDETKFPELVNNTV